MNTTDATTVIVLTTTPAPYPPFVIPPGVGERLRENAWVIFGAYFPGLILNVILFIECLHLYKHSYGIIVLNQLLINIFFCLTYLEQYIVIYVCIGTGLWFESYSLYLYKSSSWWAWLTINICVDLSASLFYVMQAALFLLCANRCLTLINAPWMEPLMTYKMHMFYSAVCWVFQLDYFELYISWFGEVYTSMYLLVVFVATIAMCVGLYIKLSSHLRSTSISSSDRTRYRQMRAVANIALIQSLFPIVTALPTVIETLLIAYYPNTYYLFVDIILPSPTLIFIFQIPTYVLPFSALLNAISIVLALADLRRKAIKIVVYLPNKIMSKFKFLIFKNNVHAIHNPTTFGAPSKTVATTAMQLTAVHR